MRPALLLALAAATAGCQETRFGRLAGVRGDLCPPAAADGSCPPAGQPCQTPGQPCPPAAQPCQPPAQPCPPPQQREVQAPPRPREAQPPVERETRTASSAVTQDIMLVPRTVYMPYAPYVPVAPVRLGAATPAGRLIETEERTRELTRPRDLPAEPDTRNRDAAVNNALDQCLQEMRKLNQRIGDLENRAVAPLPAAPPPTVVCPPPVQSVPCPPGYIYPTYPQNSPCPPDGLLGPPPSALLPPPRPTPAPAMAPPLAPGG